MAKSTGKMALLEERCRQRGVALTVQRRSIWEALAGREDHPTAEQIYEEVQARIPGVSRTTVYRVLDTLVNLGLVRKASHTGSGIRFDARTERHHHLVCVHCDRVVDLEAPELDLLPLPQARRVGFEITDFSVLFRGLCAACRRKRRTPGASGARRRRRA